MEFFAWIPRTNFFKVKFFGTLVFLRIPQRAKKVVVPDPTNVSGFRKRKWIPQIYADTKNLCGFHQFMRVPKIYVDSADNVRIPLTTCEIRLHFANFAHNLQIPLAIVDCTTA